MAKNCFKQFNIHTHTHTNARTRAQRQPSSSADLCNWMCLLLLSLWKAEPLLNFRIWDVIPPTISRCVHSPLSLCCLSSNRSRESNLRGPLSFFQLYRIHVRPYQVSGSCVCYVWNWCSPSLCFKLLSPMFPLQSLVCLLIGSHYPLWPLVRVGSVLILSPAPSLEQLHCSWDRYDPDVGWPNLYAYKLDGTNCSTLHSFCLFMCSHKYMGWYVIQKYILCSSGHI